MRQVGVLAAAGLVALRDGSAGMIDRLAEDHQNARRLADGLAGLPGVSGLDPSRVRTNLSSSSYLAPSCAASFSTRSPRKAC
jgi:threonine aldolase